MRDPNPSSPSVSDHRDRPIGRLKRRADFLRAAKGRRWHGKAFSLQAHPAPPLASGQRVDPIPRVGFTVTRKVGNSVVRNRARRRLREALRLAANLAVEPGHDYVVVARLDAIRVPFKTLQTDLSRAIRGVHAEARPHDAKKQPTGGSPTGAPASRAERTRPRP